MRISHLFFLSLFVISCNFDKKDLQSLDDVIDIIWAENICTFDNVIREVEDAGNRTLDIRLVEDGKFLLKLRKEYEIPKHSDSIEFNFNPKLLNIYLRLK